MSDVDEALEYVRNGVATRFGLGTGSGIGADVPLDEGDCETMAVLAAEVERLRQYIRVNELDTRVDVLRNNLQDALDLVARLEAENAELRDAAKLNWSAVYAQLQVANARLDWFVKFEEEAHQILRAATDAGRLLAVSTLRTWLDKNPRPKPSEGT